MRLVASVPPHSSDPRNSRHARKPTQELSSSTRIEAAGKSKYNSAALRYFAHAKRCYHKADQNAQ